MIVTEGATNLSVPFYFVDDVGGTNPGEPTTGLLFSDIETGGSASYQRQGAARVDFTLITLATASAAHADGGFILIDDTEMPGAYRCDIPDAAVVSGADFVIIYLRAASAKNTITRPLKIDLTTVDLRDGVRMGLEALPDAAAQAAGGLYTRGSGAGQINQPANGVIDINAVSATAPFFQDCFTVDSGEISGAEVEGSLILEIVKVAWDRVLTGATHNIATSAGRRLRGIQAFGDYANGALWFDSVNGTGGQVAYENATVQNPSNSITDILALASSLNMVRIEVAPGSTLTLNATLAGFSVMGVNWTLVLNGQDVSGSLFSGASVSGISTGANEIGFHHCHFANVTLPPSDLQWCVLEATFTIGTAGDFFFENCESGVAGAGTAGLDFGGALNSSNVNLRNYIGGVEIQNMGAGTGTYRLSFDCPVGQIIFNANCSATSEIELRGNHRLTNNASGLTINDDARIDVGQINAQADIALADYNGPTSGEFVDRTLLAADYFDPAADAVAVVTLVDTITTYTGNTKQTGDNYARLGAPAGASVSADVAAVKTDTGNLVNRITSALFNGITSMAQWLGLLGGKQAGNATARTELRATGAGSGTYNETADSQEAIRDRGDAAWLQGSGGDATEAKQDAIISTLITVAKTGADSDTLETLSDQMDGLAALSGEGAFTGVLTVDDGATGLEGAVVDARRGGVLIASGTTNSSGEITDWVFGSFTYDLAVRLPGYQPTTDTITVSADAWAKTISLTANTITAPPNASTTTGVMTVYDEEGSLEEGVTVTVQILDGPGTDGIGYDSTEWVATSSALGVVEFAGIILGAKYQIWRGTTKANVQKFTAPTTGDSFDLTEIIGRG